MPNDGCWIWQANKLPNGYGLFWLDGRMQVAHRISYSMAFGEIAEGLRVLHNCPDGDNPSCVRPDHLWLGTIAENNADRNQKGRAVNNLPKLQPDQVREIRKALAVGIQQKQLAIQYGVHKRTILNIKRGRCYSDVE
jgi:hypothetical protein